MTIVELETQISEATRRANALERRLEGSNELEHGIDLQRELDSLTAYRERLQSQLAGAQQRELAIQKENEQLALETELAEIRTSYQTNRDEANDLINTLTHTIVNVVEPLNEINSRGYALRNRYDTVFRKRYGRDIERRDRLEAHGLEEHDKFSDKVVGLLAEIGNELVHEKRAERLKSGV